MLNAVEVGDAAKVRQLIADGANVNRIEECTSPLVYASEKGHIDVVRLLLDKGADPNLRLPLCHGRTRIAGRVFRYRRSGATALVWARKTPVVRLLLDRGADPNIAGSREYTGGRVYIKLPLPRAFFSGNLEATKSLLAKGARPNIYNREGKNVLLDGMKTIKRRFPARAKEFAALLRKYRARHLDVSDAALRRTQGKVMKTYKHKRSGAVTTMSDAIARRLYNRPFSLVEITYSSKHKAFYHMFEFEWTATGQNMHEWMIQRRLYKKKFDK